MLGEALVHPLPETSRRSRGDRDAAFLLLFHVIHDRGAIMDFADLVRNARVKQNTLGRGGLTRVDMSGDTDVAVALDWRNACH